MKTRILTDWTFIRALYLLMGGYIIFQSAIHQQWLGVALGGYFASMGLFAFGCASGNCFNTIAPKQKIDAAIKDVKYEEVK